MSGPKRCFKCDEIKPISEFYKHPRMADGHFNKCKECTKRDVSKNYEDKREQYSEYDRRREQTPERKADKAKALKRYRLKNPVKVRARSAISNGKRSGKLQVQPCVHCGTAEGVQAHHEDYERPLDVIWVCFKCHREHEHGQVVTKKSA